MTVRTKKYELKAGQTRQIKIIDIEKPIRFVVESGAFNYQVKVNDQNVGVVSAVPNGVLTAPGDCWGSELEIICAGDGILHVAHVG